MSLRRQGLAPRPTEEAPTRSVSDFATPDNSQGLYWTKPASSPPFLTCWRILLTMTGLRETGCPARPCDHYDCQHTSRCTLPAGGESRPGPGCSQTLISFFSSRPVKALVVLTILDSHGCASDSLKAGTQSAPACSVPPSACCCIGYARAYVAAVGGRQSAALADVVFPDAVRTRRNRCGGSTWRRVVVV